MIGRNAGDLDREMSDIGSASESESEEDSDSEEFRQLFSLPVSECPLTGKYTITSFKQQCRTPRTFAPLLSDYILKTVCSIHVKKSPEQKNSKNIMHYFI